MNIYYTYAYLREDKTPYYIGKGKGPRAFRTSNRHCPCPADKSRVLFLKTGLSEADAFKHEVYMIAVLGRKDLGTGILRNLTDGGEGTSGNKRSEEFRARMSEVHSGKTISEEQKHQISKTLTGRTIPPEARRNMSLCKLGKKKSLETRKRMSKPKSAETRKRISIAQKNRHRNNNEQT
jgi:hypothetical protein